MKTNFIGSVALTLLAVVATVPSTWAKPTTPRKQRQSAAYGQYIAQQRTLDALHTAYRRHKDLRYKEFWRGYEAGVRAARRHRGRTTGVYHVNGHTVRTYIVPLKENNIRR